MLLIGVPVMDGHELTQRLWKSLVDTVIFPADFTLVVIDNDSVEPYTPSEFAGSPFRVSIVRNQKNYGYYYPLIQVQALGTSADIIGLVHNDLVFYEEGWDLRVRQAFVDKSDLGMIGVCGSSELDERGGRGGGTVCNFRGEVGARVEDTGARAPGITPAVVLDSMLMVTRSSLVPHLKIDLDIPICHFLDKVWPLRLYEAGYKTAVLGLEIDHISGQTAGGGNPRYDDSAEQWCKERGIDDGGNAPMAVYLDSERRFLGEYRAKGMIPSRMQGWNLVRG